MADTVSHNIVVFMHVAGERNISGNVYSESGWGWNCDCGARMLGYSSEASAEDDAIIHVEARRG